MKNSMWNSMMLIKYKTKRKIICALIIKKNKRVRQRVYFQSINNSFLNPCVKKIHVFFTILKNILHLQNGYRMAYYR